MQVYTTFGNIRGLCGHAHRSIESAVACIANDRHGCRQQGGYSDRNVRGVLTRGGHRLPAGLRYLTDDEANQVAAILTEG